MEFIKMIVKVLIPLIVLAIAAMVAGCSSTLEVSSGVTSLDEVSKTRALALEQIAYLRESSGDSVVREQMILQIEKALADQAVVLLSREKTARFNLNTSNTLQAPELFREFQATESDWQLTQTPIPSLNGLIVNKRNEEVVVRVKGPNNWSLERLIKAQSRVEISLPAYGEYRVVFLNGHNSSAILRKEVMPNKHYFDEAGDRHDLLATVFQ